MAKAIQKVKPSSLAKMEPWEIELADKAKAEQATETLGVPRITHKSGLLKVDGEEVEGNKLPVIIVTYGLMKTYYEEAYDPDAQQGQTPDCFAFASAAPGEEEKMVPHPVAPNKQAEACTGCPHNAFGTAIKGKGKRCQDKRRVLCMVEVKDKKSIAEAQVRQFEIPPGSLRNWGAYLKGLKEITNSGNVRTVVTELSTKPAENAYQLIFKPVRALSKEQALAVIEKGKQCEPDLAAPFPTITRDDTPKSKRSEKSNKKLK